VGSWESGSQNVEFRDPLVKFGTGKARDFKFGILIDLGISQLKGDKIPLK